MKPQGSRKLALLEEHKRESQFWCQKSRVNSTVEFPSAWIKTAFRAGLRTIHGPTPVFFLEVVSIKEHNKRQIWVGIRGGFSLNISLKNSGLGLLPFDLGVISHNALRS